MTIASVKLFWKFCGGMLLSRTLTVKVELPGVVGVPLSTPAEDSDKPAGGEPKPDTMDQL